MENATPHHITSAQEESGDKLLDSTLRPQKLDDYIGQSVVKNNLRIFIEAAKNRGEALEHVLVFGPPGLGKTTLAHIIANEMGNNLKITSGPAIERAGDLAAILTNMTDGDVLFIDEIHRLNKTVEEILYPAMEDYVLDIIIGKGPSARTLRLDLPKFTIIGATTKMSGLSSPLRDRFGNVYRLNFYQSEEINQIIKRAARILKIEIDESATEEIAKRARQTPRIANRLLKRVRDFAQVKKNGKIDKNAAQEALTLLEVDEYGLDNIDRQFLETIIKKFNGGPVGLNTIASSLAEEMDTIEDVIEPFLLQIGMINRTPRGRVATASAYQHFKLTPPADWQNKLL
ncbi:MAG TPA: Holliday junction branch migration DNA helicase RuvB [bacterium]|nr:Holliday junction branch migration DNA helicase RuvB [bacterium]HNS34253.1 Holliday junction branch migration DNA helicase RuvB [bacterium]HNZ73300.1 Holliday junction branch migration DNA helicase RuvB [bacterium]HOH67423.1 Holliday junction branch migration DNA helicase RuvB [bacterium]